MSTSLPTNPYYETPEFNRAFNELVEISKTYYESSLKKRANLEALAEHLYSEVGHYIFELLQNADDAKATEVCFRLNKDSLEFGHNGTKFFTIENIEAICTYGAGEKSDDSETIGRFGVGFKATSRITETPKIRSNQFAFQIIHQVIPQKIDAEDLAGMNFATHFKFTFGTKVLDPESIYKESLTTLLNIDSRNLLFLNSIKLIIIEMPEQSNKKRILGKREIDPNIVELKQSLDGTQKSVESEYYLKYTRDIEKEKIEKWAISNGKNVDKKISKLAISLAIKCEIKIENQGFKVEGISALPQGQLFVFFPAKNEVTGLKFHIHAPFAATTTRENIKDNSSINSFLFDEFTVLLLVTLNDLVSRKILNTNGLEIFPNSGDELRDELKPLQKVIIDFFSEKKNHLPLPSGEFTSHEHLLEISSDVGNLFSEEDLQFICSFKNQSKDSVSEIHFIQRSKNARVARFLSTLGIRTYTVLDLAISFSYINSEYALQVQDSIKKFSAWLERRDLEWLRKFYILMSKLDLSRIGVYFNKIPIIRICDPNKLYSIPSEAFISRNGEKTGPNFVDPNIIDFSMGRLISPDDGQIWRFLESSGVRQFSKSMLLQDKISSYFEFINSQEVSELTPDRSLRDALDKLLEFVHGDVDLERSLTSQRIFLTESDIGELMWHSGNLVYIDSPFKPATGFDSTLAGYKGSDRRFRLWGGYSDIPNIESKLARLEVLTDIIANSPGQSATGEYSIPFLKEYLKHGNLALRKNIWKYLKSASANRERHFLRFPNAYLNGSKELSQLAKLLKDTAWIPDRKGKLSKPSQLDSEKIAPEFLYEKCDFLDAIEFGAETEAALQLQKEKLQEKQRKDEAARLLGATNSDEIEELIKAMKKNPKKLREILEAINRPIPSDHVADPLAVSETTAKKTREQPDFEMELIQSIRREGANELVAERKEYLKNTYISEGVIPCQICSISSFTKTTNSEPFFVAIMVISDFSKNSIYNAIAVCAQCYAKFKWAKKSTDLQLKNSILGIKDYSGTAFVDVHLGGEIQQIKFKETHFANLRGALLGANDFPETSI